MSESGDHAASTNTAWMARADTVVDLVRAAADQFGAATALVDGDSRWSFSDLYDLAPRGAAALYELGIGPGDTVGIWAPNCGEWVVAALAAAFAGAILVPCNTRNKGAETAEMLRRARVRVLFTSRSLLGLDYPAMLASAGGPELRDLRMVVLRGVAGPEEIAWTDFLQSGGDRRVEFRPGPDDVSHVQFTSGTTGTPKGAMLRHRALCGTTRDWVVNVGLAPGDRYGIVSPFFHVSGHKTGMLACLTAGATMFPHPMFDPVTIMAAVDRERLTVLPGPPTIYQALLAHPQRSQFDLSSLRLAVTGAASIPPVLIDAMFEELGFVDVITAYGITETTGVVTMCRPGDDPRLIAETSGRVVDGVEIAIVDDGGRARPAGNTGEIWVRGYNLMAGYLDDDVATAAAIDADGWFHSGDVGWQDEEGNLSITDRLGDIFIVGGFNAYPAEIEAIVSAHPDVAQVAIVGRPDDRLGEVAAAFVVLGRSRTASTDPVGTGTGAFDAAAFLGWCRERMANYKVPRTVTVLDALPLNASGKVLKGELRAYVGPEDPQQNHNQGESP